VEKGQTPEPVIIAYAFLALCHDGAVPHLKRHGRGLKVEGLGQKLCVDHKAVIADLDLHDRIPFQATGGAARAINLVMCVAKSQVAGMATRAPTRQDWSGEKTVAPAQLARSEAKKALIAMAPQPNG
jgi:hypothetical protein